jgi:hypothetical protein
MKRYLALLLWLMLALACSAAEIVAWKVPLSGYAGRGLENDGVVRLKSPPEDSPFFKEGDELWDLKGIPAVDREMEKMVLDPTPLKIVTDPPMEWVVWNATTERLVTKADWNAIFQLHQQFRVDQMPKQVRLTAEFFEVPPNGAAPSDKSKPSATLTWVSRSGQKFAVSNEVDSTVIKAEGDLTSDYSHMDLNLHGSCSMRNHPGLDFNCSFVLRSGFPYWIVRDFNGASGLDCRISGRIELVNGTPLDEAVLIQKLNSYAPFIRDLSEPIRRRIGNKYWLITGWVDQETVATFTTCADPFADDPPEMLRESLKLQEVKVSENIKAWFPLPVWDLRKQIKAMGIVLKDSDFAGYSPDTRRIFLYTEDESELDKFETLFTPMCIRQPRQIAVSVEGKGVSRLVTRSGTKGEMTRMVNNGLVRSIKIEPTIDETGELVDVRLEYLNQPDSAHKQSITTSLNLQSGKSNEIMSAVGNDADEKALRVKAEIMHGGIH